MSFLDADIFITEDGSHSLIHPQLEESYHSNHGAIQESLHTFIHAGLHECTQKDLQVLEIGFGTGLNAFLTLLEAEKKQLNIQYTAIELFPISMAVVQTLNYPELSAKGKKEEFYLLHSAAWDEITEIRPNFQLQKLQADFTKLALIGKFDLIYFDAFSPDKQPEMWTEERFQMLYNACNEGAVLTVYKRQGSVRRAMQTAGFIVERIGGAKGKREMLRARKAYLLTNMLNSYKR